MLEKIIEIMQDVCEIEDEITPESRFVEDFGISSLEMFKLITEIEEEFDVSIPTRKLQGIRTVFDLMNEIAK
ncbi:MAG: acyl carrier protein [Clostridia bacterium]|nr:acyl carrier protein [Clostridia bacterium]MBQ5770214.1 acyl carrier protein [Clostridia bacterium]